MIPSASLHAPAPKPAVVNTPLSAQKTTQPSAPETARASAGETAAANVRTETANTVDAPEQTAVAPRLKDQETTERSDRPKDTKAPTGPPPAFEESLLERQARVALDPPDPRGDPKLDADHIDNTPPVDDGGDESAQNTASGDIALSPTPSEQAEASFAETRGLSGTKEVPRVDVSA